MMNRKIGIVIMALCFCLCLSPFGAMAASTTDANEPIITEKDCSLTISYCSGETAFSDVQVKLYRIAEVSADFQYTLTQPFKASGLVLNGIQSSGEWDVVRSTLEAHILANEVEPTATCTTDEQGKAVFNNLDTGMYLAVVGQATKDDLTCCFDSALLALPTLGQDGRWLYEVTANAKGEVLPPVDTDEDIELKVVKLWRGDDGQARPQSIEVEIFRDGISRERVFLSNENNWSYSWTAKEDGATWSVVERNVPNGYAMTVEVRENSFVVTNTWVPVTPDEPTEPPQTGDSSNIMLYSMLMAVSGIMLILLGVVRKKSDR